MLTVIAMAGMNGSPGVRNASAYLKTHATETSKLSGENFLLINIEVN